MHKGSKNHHDWHYSCSMLIKWGLACSMHSPQNLKHIYIYIYMAYYNNNNNSNCCCCCYNYCYNYFWSKGDLESEEEGSQWCGHLDVGSCATIDPNSSWVSEWVGLEPLWVPVEWSTSCWWLCIVNWSLFAPHYTTMQTNINFHLNSWWI